MSRKITAALFIIGLTILSGLSYWTGRASAGVIDAGISAGSAVAAAPSTVAPDPASDSDGWIRAVYDAVVHHNWWMLASALLVGVCWLMRTHLGEWFAWFKTDRGGAVLVLLLATVGALATTLAAGVAPGVVALMAALKVGLGAIGGYSGVKKIIWPGDAKKVG